jgi:uncharacterized RDD family membrane protein YckC
MTDPAGGAPAPQDPGNWQSGGGASGGFQAAPVVSGPAPGVTYADTVTRVIAYIIDSLIFFVVAVFIVGIVVLAIFTGGGVVALIGSVVLAAVGLVGSAVYFVYTWTRMRASLGQKVLGLETVNAADGATLTQEQAIRRWAFMFGPTALGSALGYAPGALGLLGSLVGLLAFFYMIYLLYTVTQSPKRQGFHDVQAGTVVVKRG